ncbi:MAG TPA: hypothetical protein VF342_04930 [Alphaproteobacteria bacterium]
MKSGRRDGTDAPPRRVSGRLDGEPRLDELLDDPVMKALMARDGVDRVALIALISDVQRRLAGRRARTAPQERVNQLAEAGGQ